MTNGRETTPPSGFLTPPHIPNINTTERPPVTTTVFAATIPGNTPFANHASTSTDPTPMISTAFIDNEDLQTELEYFSEDYDEELEMEPRPDTEPLQFLHNIATETPWRSVRQRERGAGDEPPPLLAAHLGRNEDGKPPRSSLTSVHGGRQSLINPGRNLPPNGIVNGQAPSFLFPAQTGFPFVGGASAYPPQGGNPYLAGLFADPTGSVTPYVHWIKEYRLPNGLKMPSYVGSYDGKGDPDNFLHLFEGAILHNIKQREGESVRAFATRYTDDTLQILGLHEDQPISGFVHGLKARNLVEHLSTDLPSTYKGLMEKTYTWIEVREVATNGAPNDRRDNFESLSKIPREILATEKVDSQVLLVGFSGEKSWAIGEVLLEITIGNAPLTRSGTLNFVIVRSNSPYNMLLGRTTMQKMGMVVSTIHKAVKFHTTQGIGTVFSTHIFAVPPTKIEECKEKSEETIKYPRNTEGVLSCTNAEERIIVNSKFPEQTVTIGKQLPEHFKERLRNLLRTNMDVFAWTRADMTGIPKTITVNGKPFHTKHKLNEYSHIKLIKQKRQSLGPNRNITTRKEVEELTRVGILREAVHQTWVANPVMVKKSDRGWRMYVDFTDINKACPKDCYPLPEIDWKMPFGLKNTGATYQRLVDKVFNDQIRRNLEAYVDDMVIKSISEEDMLANIKETFQRFRSINMKLNPKKCSFGIEEGPFLGHLITKQGIRANPSKVKAIINIEQPKMLKDIQSLNKKLAALS
ncbi:reverse transcriptase domain-containing protein [Tanacetum coccineum]